VERVSGLASGFQILRAFARSVPSISSQGPRLQFMNLVRHWANLVFVCGFVCYVIIRHVFEKRAKVKKSISSRSGLLEKLLIATLSLGIFFLPVLYLFTGILAFADYRANNYVQWCGGVVMLLSLWLFWRSHVDLGPNFSMTLEIKEDHELVTNGVYRYVRHPMYASIWLWAAAQAMLLQNWVAGLAALITFAPMYFARIPREEAMMADTFQEEYNEYKSHTGRVFPRFL